MTNEKPCSFHFPNIHPGCDYCGEPITVKTTPKDSLEAACRALIDAPHPDHFASRLGDEELAALNRIKALLPPATPAQSDEPVKHVFSGGSVPVVPPSASPEPGAEPECICFKKDILEPCKVHPMATNQLPPWMVAPDPSSPERERAQDTPWRVQEYLETSGVVSVHPPSPLDQVYVADRNGIRKLQTTRMLAERIVAAVNAEAEHKHTLDASLILGREVDRLQARLREAERLLRDHVFPCWNCGFGFDHVDGNADGEACKECQPVRVFLAESRR